MIIETDNGSIQFPLESQFEPYYGACRCAKVGCSICDITMHKKEAQESLDARRLVRFLNENSFQTCDPDQNLFTREHDLSTFIMTYNAVVEKNITFYRVNNYKQCKVCLYVPEQACIQKWKYDSDPKVDNHNRPDNFDKLTDECRQLVGFHNIKLSDLEPIWKPVTMKEQQKRMIAKRCPPRNKEEVQFDSLVGRIMEDVEDPRLAGILEFNDPEATFMFVHECLNIDYLPRYKVRWVFLSSHRVVHTKYYTAEELDKFCNQVMTIRFMRDDKANTRIQNVYPSDNHPSLRTPPNTEVTNTLSWFNPNKIERKVIVEETIKPAESLKIISKDE